LLADDGRLDASNPQLAVEQLQADFDLDTEGLDMVFFALPDAAPQPVYQSASVVVVAPATVPDELRKRTYGVCKLIVANERPSEHLQDSSVNSVYPSLSAIMQEFLPKDVQLQLSLPAGAHIDQDVDDWYLDWQESLKTSIVRAPQHGEYVVIDDRYHEHYLPEKGYVGKDRIDMLIEGKDDRGRPISATIRFYLNVVPEKELNKAIANSRTYSHAIKQYCGTNKDTWRISDSGPASVPAFGQAGDLTGLYSQAAYGLQFTDLPSGALGQSTGTTITLDDNAAGHGWFIDSTPWSNEEWLPTHNPNEWVAKIGSDAAGKMDMLSVLLHEYGHVLGIEHSADHESYMATTLTPGTRRLPSSEELAHMAELVGELKRGRSG
jgi:hypothetical protein